MEFKTNIGEIYTPNFSSEASEFIIKSRAEGSSRGKIIPFPFDSGEIQEIENIFHDEIKDNPTHLQSVKDYHSFREKGEETPDELDENIEEVKDVFNSLLVLNWEVCEELFGDSGESFQLEDGSVSDSTMNVFEDTVLFYFAYLAK